MKKFRIAICSPSRNMWKAKFGMCLTKLFAWSLLQSNHDITFIYFYDK